jgi:CheY-like chemotaxis protein
VQRLFSFAARIDDVARHVAEVLNVLGNEFDRSLVQAAVHEAVVNAVIYGALGIPPPTGVRDMDQLMSTIRIRERDTRPSLGVSVLVRTDPDRPREALIIVRDPGAGFDWRGWLRASRKGVSPSTSWSNVPVHGRGLVIMQAGAKQLSWNESGNEVTLLFEAAPVSKRSSRSTPVLETSTSGNRQAGAKVLLVDDRPGNLRVLSRTLQSMGCDLRVSTSGEKALNEILSWKPDAVFVNARMSEMSGIEMLRRMRLLVGVSSIIAVAYSTGGRDPGLSIAARRLGAFDFIELPVWKVELSVRLRRAIRAAYPLTIKDSRGRLADKPA